MQMHFLESISVLSNAQLGPILAFADRKTRHVNLSNWQFDVVIWFEYFVKNYHSGTNLCS